MQAPERNHVDNLRLLVSKPYKTLKDQTEGRIKKFKRFLPFQPYKEYDNESLNNIELYKLDKEFAKEPNPYSVPS